uniref:Uncharacterized protein n=1 Tax=Populus trichocarpa TaxID=3694 RepID=A0A3N7G9E9_POPTR
MIRVRHDQETILFKLQSSLRRLFFDNEIFEYILLFKCMEATEFFERIAEDLICTRTIWVKFLYTMDHKSAEAFHVCNLVAGCPRY